MPKVVSSEPLHASHRYILYILPPNADDNMAFPRRTLSGFPYSSWTAPDPMPAISSWMGNVDEVDIGAHLLASRQALCGLPHGSWMPSDPMAASSSNVDFTSTIPDSSYADPSVAVSWPTLSLFPVGSATQANSMLHSLIATLMGNVDETANTYANDNFASSIPCLAFVFNYPPSRSSASAPLEVAIALEHLRSPTPAMSSSQPVGLAAAVQEMTRKFSPPVCPCRPRRRPRPPYIEASVEFHPMILKDADRPGVAISDIIALGAGSMLRPYDEPLQPEFPKFVSIQYIVDVDGVEAPGVYLAGTCEHVQLLRSDLAHHIAQAYVKAVGYDAPVEDARLIAAFEGVGALEGFDRDEVMNLGIGSAKVTVTI
ncbi:hypothetical protein FB45DRAFT_870389 [Roridomyces roridus]|uniref:Uncharacterized protein n=1 Tax=Roridomyces roridus TaxID=1738132 RepID=A0AAD7FG46_9AGAR|nr:hypothetical protein FB45DRAFT_870389 [Roridomyces roridus]